MIPQWSVPIPSSSSARIIPSDSWPRSFAFRSSLPSGMIAPGLRDRDRLPGRDVVGAADDLDRRRAADVDHADAEPVGVGVLVPLEHLPDDEVLEPVDAVVLDPLDLGAGHRQPLRQRLGVEVRSAVLVQPLEGNPHANCSRKRMSLS